MSDLSLSCMPWSLIADGFTWSLCTCSVTSVIVHSGDSLFTVDNGDSVSSSMCAPVSSTANTYNDLDQICPRMDRDFKVLLGYPIESLILLTNASDALHKVFRLAEFLDNCVFQILNRL